MNQKKHSQNQLLLLSSTSAHCIVTWSHRLFSVTVTESVHSHQLRGRRYASSVRASGWLDGCESCPPHPLTEKQNPRAHNRKAHTCHIKESSQLKGMHMQPLDSLSLSLWGLAGCSLFKIIARCSQSTMDSGRGTSKVNTRLIWTSSIHLPLGGKKTWNKMQDKRTHQQLLICMSASILTSNRIKFIVSNQLSTRIWARLNWV